MENFWWFIEREDLHSMAKDMYSNIKDNEYIPKEIRDAWCDLCVSECNVKDLCN